MNKKNKKVLIAEDDRDVMCVLREGLQEYSIISAYDGSQAWDKINRERPDIIILDVMMPGIDGSELNKKLKEKKELKDIPVIIITGRPDMEGLFSDRGSNAVTGFLEKPFMLKHLKRELERIES